MNRKLFTIGLGTLLFLGQLTDGYSQIRQEKKAERQTEQFAYSKAIDTYQNIIEKGRGNALVYVKLADAYYFNAKLADAFTWYDKYFSELNDQTAEPEHYFRYAQTLKAVGQQDKATTYLNQWIQEFATEQEAKYYKMGLVLDKEFKKPVELTPSSFNSQESDYGTAVVEGQVVFTSSRQLSKQAKEIDPWTNQPYTSLYKASLADQSQVTALTIEGELSTINYSSAVFSKDGQVMFFTANNRREKGKKRYNKNNSAVLKVYKASKLGDGMWGKVEELSINSDDFNTAHPSLSSNQQYLYFSSDRPGGYGQSDIYKVALENLTPTGEVANLGGAINTSGRETYPYVEAENLYFSSDARLGFGGLDIFKVENLSQVTDQLAKVVNLGEQFNSEFDDFAYYQTSKSTGYLSSNRPSELGLDNVYYFSICSAMFKGALLDKQSLSGIGNGTLELLDNSKVKVGEIQANDLGEFSTEDVNCGQTYWVNVSAEGYNSEILQISIDKVNPIVDKDIHLTKIIIKKPWEDLRFDPIYFGFDKSGIREDDEVVLEQIKTLLETYPEISIVIEAHTDSRGSKAYNIGLSDRRAKKAATWFTNRGIEAHRVKTKAMGESQLLNDCDGSKPCKASEHALNRRGEFKIIEN
ncbi:OmpA family protein [Myroides pelagicus]|uniref:OmpA family protein n=1 Tax=Myroides pelagicus TaxID=270914 RepID=A0A7K1GPW7_9FLAO|nr:OmpA family protein [Myroides pelagicus]MTH30896.1 OmpA family protein [Myroides pelagicus]